MHKHKCKCGAIWEHDSYQLESHDEHTAGHVCPKCGNDVYLKYFGKAPVNTVTKPAVPFYGMKKPRSKDPRVNVNVVEMNEFFDKLPGLMLLLQSIEEMEAGRGRQFLS